MQICKKTLGIIIVIRARGIRVSLRRRAMRDDFARRTRRIGRRTPSCPPGIIALHPAAVVSRPLVSRVKAESSGGSEGGSSEAGGRAKRPSNSQSSEEREEESATMQWRPLILGGTFRSLRRSDLAPALWRCPAQLWLADKTYLPIHLLR